MTVRAVASRYARALLEIAEAERSIEQIGKELGRVSDLLERSAELNQIFKIVTITPAEHIAIVEELASKLRVSKVTRNLLCLLAERRRLPILTSLTQQYQQLADEKLGIITAIVEAPIPLDSVRLRQLESALSSEGQKVRVIAKVDPTILGGVRLRIGGKVHDATIDAQLSRLRDSLLSQVA